MKTTLLTACLCITVLFISAQSINFEDSRAASTAPSTYNGKFKPSFKFYTSIGLPSISSGYYSVLGLRGWGDNSGGKAHELAFGDDNNVFLRSGFDPSWESWRKLVIQDVNGNTHLEGSLTMPDAQVYRGANFSTSDYSTMGFYSRAWSTVQGVNGKAFSFQTHNNAGNGGFEMMAIYYGESGKITMVPNGGNVAIGTTDTQGYKLAVNGSIRAKEIKVEATPWPDYVFRASYKLPDLKETENFIKVNGHLPEIPSAAEVEKEGVGLGEMNARLLKKIEELTLHLIDQNKRLDAQQETISKQQKQINSLLTDKY